MKRSLNRASKSALSTGALITGAGALIGGRIGFSIAGFGVAQMLLGGANMIQESNAGLIKKVSELI